MQSNVTRRGTGLYAAKPGCDTGNLIHAYRLVREHQVQQQAQIRKSRCRRGRADTDQEEKMQERKGRCRRGRADAEEEEQMQKGKGQMQKRKGRC